MTPNPYLDDDPFDHLLVAGALDAQAQVGRIRSAARFGQRDGDQRLAAGELLEPRLHDLGLAVLTIIARTRAGRAAVAA